MSQTFYRKELVSSGQVLSKINYSDYFEFTVKTDNTGTSSSDQFTVPTVSAGTYNSYVDWGDGLPIQYITTYNDARWTHTFAGGAGTYTVKIWGTLKGLSFNNGGDKLKLLNISQWGCFNPKNQSNIFYGCTNLTVPATDAPDLTGVTTLQTFFRDCKALTTIPGLRYWDTSNITQFTSMFIGCDNFNEPGVGYLNTSSATLMNYMFSSCYKFNQPLPNFDTSNVTTFGLQGMFNNCLVFDQDISHFVINPAITTLVQFLTNVTLSTTNYDALLIAWASQASLPSSISFAGGNSKFTADRLLVTSITRSGSTATVTTSSAHGLSNGAEIAIVGATQSEYNIPAVISNVTPTTFDYTVSGTPTSPATGTIYVYRAAAGIARQKLVNTYSWTITDGGVA